MMTEFIVQVEKSEFNYSSVSPSKRQTVVHIPNLQLKAGERLFIGGPSGSGKSTLLGLVTGLLKPQQGRIQVLGHDFTKLGVRQKDKIRGEQMGYIFQLFNLVPYLTVRQNISLPCEFHSERLKKIQSDSLKDEVHRLAKALEIEELLGNPVSQLSVGQQQRVAAARALIGRPALIIADEPTSALDKKNRDQFMTLLLKEAEHFQSTLIFVSHDTHLSAYFNRTLLLSPEGPQESSL